MKTGLGMSLACIVSRISWCFFFFLLPFLSLLRFPKPKKYFVLCYSTLASHTNESKNTMQNVYSKNPRSEKQAIRVSRLCFYLKLLNVLCRRNCLGRFTGEQTVSVSFQQKKKKKSPSRSNSYVSDKLLGLKESQISVESQARTSMVCLGVYIPACLLGSSFASILISTIQFSDLSIPFFFSASYQTRSAQIQT